MNITREQEALLVAALEKAERDVAAFGGWLRLNKSAAVVVRGEQTFAVFGHPQKGVAQDVSDWDDEDSTGLVGVVRGHAWEQVLDEGPSGVLTLVLDKRRNRWAACWAPRRWLWASELRLSDAEIAARTGAEIEAGATVLTVPPPGWA